MSYEAPQTTSQTVKIEDYKGRRLVIIETTNASNGVVYHKSDGLGVSRNNVTIEAWLCEHGAKLV